MVANKPLFQKKIHEVSGEFSRTLAAIKPYRLRRHHLHASPPAPEP
jgi:hypothetical protein